MEMLAKKKSETKRRIGSFLMEIIPYGYYECELGTFG
jgi:predicted transcriptional regulator with HTH domain